jgi:hypothetical protein
MADDWPDIGAVIANWRRGQRSVRVNVAFNTLDRKVTHKQDLCVFGGMVAVNAAVLAD